MASAISNFIKDNAVSVVMSLATAGYGGAIFAFMESSGDAWSEYPIPLAAFCMLAFLLGITVSHIYYSHVYGSEKKTREREIMRRIELLPDRTKACLLELYEEESPYIVKMEYAEDFIYLKRANLAIVINGKYMISMNAKDTILSNDRVLKDLENAHERHEREIESYEQRKKASDHHLPVDPSDDANLA